MAQMNAMMPPLASAQGPDATHAAVAPSDGTTGSPVIMGSTGSTDWRLGPNVPQSPNQGLRRLGLWILTRAGWRFEGAMPNVPKFVVIVAPHTSNWDFPVGLAAKWALGLDAHWWGKDTLFMPPFGWFFRANGGIPVDRKNSSKVVDATIDGFRSNAKFALALAPEGTRKKVTQWRTGFWHVAKGANVPICCVAFDWPRRLIRLGPTTMPDEDDPSTGIARIRSYFAEVQGYNPSQQA